MPDWPPILCRKEGAVQVHNHITGHEGKQQQALLMGRRPYPLLFFPLVNPYWRMSCSGATAPHSYRNQQQPTHTINRLHRPASGMETSPVLYGLFPEGKTRTHDICTASFIVSLACVLALILVSSLLTANEVPKWACSDFPTPPIAPISDFWDVLKIILLARKQTGHYSWWHSIVFSLSLMSAPGSGG